MLVIYFYMLMNQGNEMIMCHFLVDPIAQTMRQYFDFSITWDASFVVMILNSYFDHTSLEMKTRTNCSTV